MTDQPSIYGITNRNRLGEATVSTRTHYHSTWTNINNNTPRFDGNGHNVNVISPINGNPLTFWQIPPAFNQYISSSSDNNNNLVFSNDDLIRNPPMVNISNNCEYKPKGEVQDHVSLDLHL